MRIIALSRSHDSLGRSSSKLSSTAANVTSVPACGTPAALPPATGCVTCTSTCTFWRTAYCGWSVLTLTVSSCAAVPTCSAATPNLNDGLDRSTIAVGAWYARPSYQNERAQLSGSRQPQVKNEYQGTSRMRPRSASTLTYTLGPQALSIFSSTVGSLPRSVTTRVSMRPSRSTLTSAVAPRYGMRTCSRAVCPGATSRCSGRMSMRSSLSWANHSSPRRVTHTPVAACAGWPAASLACAISSICPGVSICASHANAPRSSVLPLHSVPSSLISVRLS